MAESTGAVTAAVSIGLFCGGFSILGAASDTGATSVGATSFSIFSAEGLVTSFLPPKKLPKKELRLPPFLSNTSGRLAGESSGLVSSVFPSCDGAAAAGAVRRLALAHIRSYICFFFLFQLLTGSSNGGSTGFSNIQRPMRSFSLRLLLLLLKLLLVLVLIFGKLFVLLSLGLFLGKLVLGVFLRVLFVLLVAEEAKDACSFA